MILPERIFFTGIPGSGWSVIAQTIEKLAGFNISDRTPERSYSHVGSGARHQGAYFGQGMEFSTDLSLENINSPWIEPRGTRIVKSHEWALCLDKIKQEYPRDWIFLVYKSELESLERWLGSGGFDITYPNYSAYKNKEVMLDQIKQCNTAMLDFALKHQASWSEFTSDWTYQIFGQRLPDFEDHSGALVTLIK